MISRLKFPSLFKTGRSDKRQQRRQGLMLHLAAVLVLILSAAVSFFTFFPEQLLRDRLERLVLQESGGEMAIGGLAFTPPFRLQLSDVVWQPQIPGWPPVRIESLRLAPEWLALFGTNPGMEIRALLPSGGALQGWLKKDGSLEAEFTGIALRPFFPPEFSYLPQGIAAGRLKASGPLLTAKSEAELEVTIEGAEVTGLEKLGVGSGRLTIGRLSARGGLGGGALRIDKLSNEGGDIRLEGKGVVLLKGSPGASRITALVDLTPGAGLDPMLRDLLPLTGVAPDKKGNFRFRIRGSLEKPAIH